ncbi:nucleoside hydrolase [bacterium]|nr:nucleoside hydrolase [bacterium]
MNARTFDKILIALILEKGGKLAMNVKALLTRIIGGVLAMFLLVSCSNGKVLPMSEELLTPQAPVRSPMHIIWDDDGSPDGVIALLYFLRHPEINVKAITVSCGEAHPKIFAQNLIRMLALLGRTDIPVAAGRSTPLKGNNAFPEPWREATDIFWGIELPEPVEAVQPMSAAKLIVEVINRSPDPLTVFVIGNHTNLAEALRLDPTIADRIRVVESMGGALFVKGNLDDAWPKIRNRVAEWNIWVDPLAASEVFSSGLAISLTPLDATNKVIWTSADAAAWEASGTSEGILAAKILRWMLRSWSPKGIYVWDLVAAVNVTHPNLCKHEQVHLQVITEPGDYQGQTVVDRNAPPNANTCITPKAKIMRKHVTKVFKGP